MKKLIIISISIFTLGLAANSFAVPAEIPTDTTAATAKGDTKITIGGELRVRGVVQHNTSEFNRNKSEAGKNNIPVTATREQPPQPKK
jgi:hypothetical protein